MRKKKQKQKQKQIMSAEAGVRTRIAKSKVWDPTI